MIRVHQGVDIVKISRVRDLMERHASFAEDVFTEREREYCRAHREPYRHFAGRFAAKESYLKALGTGLSGEGVDGGLREIEVLPSASGRPEIVVSGWVGRLARARKIEQCSLSISHDAGYAVAAVVLVQTQAGGK